MPSSVIYVPVDLKDGSIKLFPMEANEKDRKEFQNEIDSHRKKMQRHGRCKCRKSKMHLCSGICTVCSFRSDGDMVRLDASVSGSNGKSRISDFLVDGTPSPEDIVSSCEQLEKLRSKFSRLEPESERILKFFMEDVSLSEMARRLGRDRKEFAEQMKKYLGILADHIGR